MSRRLPAVLRADPTAPLSDIFPVRNGHTGERTGQFFLVIKHRGAPWQPVTFPSLPAAEAWVQAYRRYEEGPATDPLGMEVMYHYND